MHSHHLHPRNQLRALWAFGSNGNGQLGVGHDQDSAIPSLTCMEQQAHHEFDSHWHIDDSLGLAAAGGNHSALISCPDRALWMAGSDNDNECLRSTVVNGNSSNNNVATTKTEDTTPNFQFHRLHDSLFLQALDNSNKQSSIVSPNTTTNNIDRGLTRHLVDDESSTHVIRWCSVACGWAFTVGVAKVEELVSPDRQSRQNHGIHQPLQQMPNPNQLQQGFADASSCPSMTLISSQAQAQEPTKCEHNFLSYNEHHHQGSDHDHLDKLPSQQHSGQQINSDASNRKSTMNNTNNHDSATRSTENVVFVWGVGRFGELGLGPDIKKTGPQPVRLRFGVLAQPSRASSPSHPQLRYEVIKVQAGLRHVVAMARDRDQCDKVVLIGWGNNRYGQIGMLQEPLSTHARGKPFGISEVRSKITEPVLLYFPRLDGESGGPPDTSGVHIVDIACGESHTLVLLSDGTVYSSGLNKHGQLGPFNSKEEGVDSTISSTVATATGTTSKALPFRVRFEQVVGLPFVDRISCGWSHNAAMNSTSSSNEDEASLLYLWGRNDHGQLGNASSVVTTAQSTSASPFKGLVAQDSKVSPVFPVPGALHRLQITSNNGAAPDTIRSFSCGSEHTLVMTTSGKVYAWGWNEHGNCGVAQQRSEEGEVADDDRLDVFAPRPVFIPSQNVVCERTEGQVMGGYGSSWILLP